MELKLNTFSGIPFHISLKDRNLFFEKYLMLKCIDQGSLYCARSHDNGLWFHYPLGNGGEKLWDYYPGVINVEKLFTSLFRISYDQWAQIVERLELEPICFTECAGRITWSGKKFYHLIRRKCLKTKYFIIF